MRVLVACEFSGIVRDAFIARGHDAMSCDLLDSERPGPHHKGDVLDIIGDGWDLMIAHPPCPYLTLAANGWHAKRYAEREPKRREAFKFFMDLYNAPIEKVCLENPVGVISTLFRKPDQVIQPHFFGHPERKATCFWLRGLPPLHHAAEKNLFTDATHVTPEPVRGLSPKGKRYYTMNLLPLKDRAKVRSRTFKGVAIAMAQQWGGIAQERVA